MEELKEREELAKDDEQDEEQYELKELQESELEDEEKKKEDWKLRDEQVEGTGAGGVYFSAGSC